MLRYVNRPQRDCPMMLSCRRKAAIGLATLALLGAIGYYFSGRRRPKNVILITLDGARQDHLSLNGYERKTSPNIDWLAEQGTYFSTIIATGCSTKGSLTSLLTSLGFASHGIFAHEASLPKRAKTLAEAFRERGYRSGGFVATPMLAKSMGYGRGFDQYEDFMSRRMDLVLAPTVMDEALKWLASLADDDKYFLYLHFEEPHPPWPQECPWCDKSNPAQPLTDCTTIPPEALFEKEVALKALYLKEYDGAIWSADHQIGRLLERLRTRGELDRTVIAVSTDHGYELLDRYHVGHGRNPFDEVVKIFLVLYGEGKRRSTNQGSITDIGPTLLGSAGIAKPPEFEGRDLIRQGFASDPMAFTQGYGVVSVRTKRYKLIEVNWPSDIPQPKYIKEYGFQLFDLLMDPRESVDVKGKYPRESEQLRNSLLDYSKRLIELTRSQKTIHQDLDRETVDRLRSLGYIR
jgi:arylsulfatase A-like enzyme